MTFKNVASYSHSKAKMMGLCPLSYWRYTYGSWNGWWNRSRPPKDPVAGSMYEAKHVESEASWRGKLVHTACERALKASMGGRRFGGPDGVKKFMLQRTEQMFERQWQQATQQKTGSPKHRLILRDVDDINPDHVWSFVQKRIEVLCGPDELWTGMERNVNLFMRAVEQPKRIVLVEDLVSFQHAGLKVWLATDLIMRSNKGNRRCVIVDWKTGKKRKTDRLQMETYGAWCATRGWAESEAVIVYVGEDQVEVDNFEITFEMSEFARDRIEMFAEDLRDRLVDGDLERNEPIREKFEATNNPVNCHTCPFNDICEREGTKP